MAIPSRPVANSRRAIANRGRVAPQLRSALARLNSVLTATEVDEVTAKLASFRSQSLVDSSCEMYDWLRNGVPLTRVESDGRRSVLRVEVIDFSGVNGLVTVQQFTVHRKNVRRSATERDIPRQSSPHFMVSGLGGGRETLTTAFTPA